jgi:hypothetical protein
LIALKRLRSFHTANTRKGDIALFRYWSDKAERKLLFGLRRGIGYRHGTAVTVSPFNARCRVQRPVAA